MSLHPVYDSILKDLTQMLPPPPAHDTLRTSTALLRLSFALLSQFPSSVQPCPSCANNLYVRSVGAEPQSSFRIPILGEVVQTGAPKPPIMTGRL